MENSKPYKNITRTASIYALLLMLLLSAFTAGAQTSVSATLSSDSDHILIGDHLNVRLTIKYPKDVKILWPRIQDSIGNMQFLSSGKIDTINQGAERILSQKMVVSAFDSGQYHAGPVVVYFRRPN
ncbi:MAG TPA: hypothetical protein VG603_13135, partial [Chitinophagales bacterium]|nr:hypothetical protein [Chitinophagales bacterium]